jgi:hypothetical protein
MTYSLVDAVEMPEGERSNNVKHSDSAKGRRE